jgi:uncharacterized protein YdeI (YjbR/CyaY-like superfamily)
VATGHTAATFFASPAEFRRWLAKHHGTATELWVGFHRKATGRPSLTWPESVAEALCVGWIDGIRKRVDDTRYAIRFTPRKPTSTWSAVNVKLMEELLAAGRVQPAGLRAWEQRAEARTGIYAYEQREHAALTAADERAFRRHRAAWEYWQSRAPGLRKTMAWWVVSAKKPETRAKRLASLIEKCAQGALR